MPAGCPSPPPNYHIQECLLDVLVHPLINHIQECLLDVLVHPLIIINHIQECLLDVLVHPLIIINHIQECLLDVLVHPLIIINHIQECLLDVLVHPLIIINHIQECLLDVLVHPLIITNHIQECLLDVLVHPEGPRLRDRISHGEVQCIYIDMRCNKIMQKRMSCQRHYVIRTCNAQVDVSTMSKTLASHVVSVAIIFCAQYCLDPGLCTVSHPQT